MEIYGISMDIMIYIIDINGYQTHLLYSIVSQAMMVVAKERDRLGLRTWMDMGVSIVMGVPQNRWFLWENPIK